MVLVEDEHGEQDIVAVKVERRNVALPELEHLSQGDVVALPDPPPARG